MIENRSVFIRVGFFTEKKKTYLEKYKLGVVPCGVNNLNCFTSYFPMNEPVYIYYCSSSCKIQVRGLNTP